MSLDSQVSDTEILSPTITNTFEKDYPLLSRQDIDSPISVSDTSPLRIDDEKKEDLCVPIKNKIFRFKLSKDMMDVLSEFSKIHQYDIRDDYNEAWKIFLESNHDFITQETERLLGLGYDGNILDKLYKSGRYYFRTKSLTKKDAKDRKKYVGMTRAFIKLIDEHINQNIYNHDYTPANGYDYFCKENLPALGNEITYLKSTGIHDKDEIISKIKKTYKNRYFQQFNSLRG